MQKNNILDQHKLMIAFLILLPLVVVSVSRTLGDYGFYYLSPVRLWLAGETQLFEEKAPYYYMPWSAILMIPFALLPDQVGQAIFNTLSIAALIWGVNALAQPKRWWSLTLAVTNLYVGMLILVSQWDTFILASLALGWIAVKRRNPWLLGMALTGISSKPTGVIIPAIFLLYMVRKWSRQDLIRMLTIPLMSVIASFFVSGLDWPIRYLKFIQEYPPTPLRHYILITPWGNVDFLLSHWDYLGTEGRILFSILTAGILAWLVRCIRRKQNNRSMCLAMLVNTVVSPYALIFYYIYLAPIVTTLTEERTWLGIFLAFVAILDVISLRLGIGVSVYPLIVLATVLIADLFTSRHQTIS